MTNAPLQIALIGFGEAAGAFAAGWAGDDGARAAAGAVAAYDVKTSAPGAAAEAMWTAYRAAGVNGCETAAAALTGAELVFSLVTADQSERAAAAAAPLLAAGAFFFDCNSVSPAAKAAAAAAISASGGRYVDAAVMAPVHPKLHKVPILAAGEHAEAGCAALAKLGMSARPVEGGVGAAAAIKLCRSIMIKGMEALAAEMTMTARRLGVEDAVFASLEGSSPEFAWRSHAARALERMAQHGTRRAAEMSEAARMVAEQAVPPRMAEATALWQAAVGALAIDMDAAPFDPSDRADRLLAALTHGRDQD